jgi:hypothetical protein
LVSINSLYSSLNWSIISCKDESIFYQYYLYSTSWHQMSLDGLFLSLWIVMYIRLLLPPFRAVSINTTCTPCYHPHRTSTAQIPPHHTESHTRNDFLCSWSLALTHSRVPTRLSCPFFVCLNSRPCTSIPETGLHAACWKTCYQEQQRHFTVFLKFICACKYIRKDVTLQIYFCKTFYVVPSISMGSKLHQVLVIQILLP